jgi:hypothetical protein
MRRALAERLKGEDAQQLLAAVVRSADNALGILSETAVAAGPSAWRLPTRLVHSVRSALDRGHGVRAPFANLGVVSAAILAANILAAIALVYLVASVPAERRSLKCEESFC